MNLHDAIDQNKFIIDDRTLTDDEIQAMEIINRRIVAGYQKNKIPDIKQKEQGMTASKTPYKVPTSSVAKRGMKKGKSIPEGSTMPSTARYLRLKIMIPLEDYERGLPYFGNRRNLNQYVVESFRERVNRAEANDKAVRIKKLLTDEDLLLSVLTHMKETGKLKSLLG